MDSDVRSGRPFYPLSTTVPATDESVRQWDPLNRSYWIGQPNYVNLAGGAQNRKRLANRLRFRSSETDLRAALRLRHAPAPFFATFPAT